MERVYRSSFYLFFLLLLSFLIFFWFFLFSFLIHFLFFLFQSLASSSLCFVSVLDFCLLYYFTSFSYLSLFFHFPLIFFSCFTFFCPVNGFFVFLIFACAITNVPSRLLRLWCGCSGLSAPPIRLHLRLFVFDALIRLEVDIEY